MKILVSACLLGVSCRYDGKSKPNQEVINFCANKDVVKICPEVLGGLKIPHPASEIKHDRVVSNDGKDVTENFVNGAKAVLKIAKQNNCKIAILKERSPSCGSGKIYDGSFSGKIVDGYGITARLLVENGIEVYGESEISNIKLF